MSDDGEAELLDVRAVAEALADVLAQRGLVVMAAPRSPTRILDAMQVGLLIGRDRRWVYTHAAELGGFRYGDGPRARLGFDLAAVERWKHDRQAGSKRAKGARGRRRSSGLVLDRGARLIPFEA